MKSSKLTPVVRIVDDDEKVLASEAFLVNMAGFRTSTYNSAKEFLEKDDPLFPGCVILDIRMPEMSGLQLQEEMKKREARKDRLHQNYLKRKANGKQQEYYERTKAKKKAEMDAKKEEIRQEDIAKGVFVPVSLLPPAEPKKGVASA